MWYFNNKTADTKSGNKKQVQKRKTKNFWLAYFIVYNALNSTMTIILQKIYKEVGQKRKTRGGE